ncbi:hypothetical protein [Flavobacterium pedocola]
MKKILLLIVLFVFSTASVSANEYVQNYETALQLKKEANYQEAVKYFLKALKDKEQETETARNICFEIADCFVKDGNEKNAVKFIKVAIRNYGATRSDVESNTVLKKEFLGTAWASVEGDFNDLHRIYLLKTGNSQRKEYADLTR